MIVDPGVLLDRTSLHVHGPPATESESDRAERIKRIAAAVKTGAYAVQTRRLAMALLDWDPRRSAAKGSAEAADRRRAYMRDYMRRRRAGRLPEPPEPALRPQVPSSWVTPAETSSS